MAPGAHLSFQERYGGGIKTRLWPPWSAVPIIVSDTLEQVFPVGEGDRVTVNTEMVPEVLLAPKVLPEPLVRPVGQFEDLVEEEGDHVEKEEVEGEVLRRCP